MTQLWQRPMTVHIGYHKTATTFLQRSVFSDAAHFTVPWSISDLDELVARPAPFTFEVDATRAELQRRGTEGDAPIVVSHEDLVGHPFSGGVTGPAIADRLVSLFPEMHVLVVVREQTGMLVSVYKQYVRAGGTERLEQFVTPKPNEVRVPSFSFDHYAYDRLVRHYQQALGPERVHVLPFELLQADPTGFVESVCVAVGAEPVPVGDGVVNPGTSAFGATLKRPLNRWFVRDAVNPAPLFPLARGAARIDGASRQLARLVPAAALRRSERRLRERAARLVGDHFASSNRELAALTGIDLVGFGYPLGS